MPDTRTITALREAIEQQIEDLCPLDDETLAELAEMLGDDITPSTLEAALEELDALPEDWDDVTLDRIASQVSEELIGVPA